MKNATAIFLVSLCIGGLSANAFPTITTQPVSRTNHIGDNAFFSVAATGTPELLYQWRLNNVDIPDATNSALNVLVTDTNVAGAYSVVVSNSVGSVVSDGATLFIPYADRAVFAQWRFNSPPYTGAVASDPDVGSGGVASSGEVWEDSLRAGTTSDPASVIEGADNNSRSLAGPRQAAGNKAAGLVIHVSTLGYKDIVISFEQNVGARASGYWRGQYSTDGGVTWIDSAVVDKVAPWALGQTGYTLHIDDLSGVEGVRNNPIFAYRIVAEWESTATGFGANAFVSAEPGNTYNNTGNPTARWDMISVMGVEDDSEEQPIIHVQPQSQVAFVGSDVQFSVTASGGNLQYQWRLNGTNILGATDSSYAVTNVQFSDAGSYSVLVSNSVGFVVSDDAILTVEESLPPGERFWSANGTTQGGGGIWDDSTPNRWGVDAAGPYNLAWNNASLDSATFGGPAGGVTLSSPITANKVTANSGYSIGGSETLTFSGDEAGIDIPGADSASVTVSARISGGDVAKTGGGRLLFSNNANTQGSTVGRYVVTQGTLSGAPAAFGAPATLVTNYFTLDGGRLGLETVGANLGANRGIYLGPNGGNIAGRVGATLTIPAPITGPGGMTIPTAFFGAAIYGGNITNVFSNPNNDYQGGTTIGIGMLRLGAAGVLPDSTTLTLTGSNGRLDLNGFTEAVGNVIISGSNSRVIDTVGTGSLVATNYDVRQSGINSGVLAGPASLTKTTAGTATLGAANTYTGDTILKQGTVILNGVGRFGNGAGALQLDGSEGSITISLNETRTEANTLINPVVFTAPEATIQSHIDAPTDIVFRHSGAWTTTGGTLFLWNASLFSFEAILSGAFDYTTPIDIGFGCRLTSANPEGTDQTYSGGISGSGTFRRSAVSGAGGRAIITSDNSYSGGTLVEAGTLLVNNPFGSGTGSGAVTVTGPGGVLGGTGAIGGSVAVNSGGAIAAGASAGILTLQNGLDLSGGGTNIWELAALKDNSDGIAGTDFDQLVLTGGELQLGGGSALQLQFAAGTAPNGANAFWQSARSWTIISLSGGANSANAAFASIVNGSYGAGNFSTSVDGGGNIVLNFTPGAPAAPNITGHPQSRTSHAGTTASFTVVATGSDPLGYQWYFNNFGNPISGANAATYAKPNVQAGDVGNYFVVVTNDLGSATSGLAALAVVPPPSLQPLAGAGTTNVVVSWPAIPGQAYQVWYNTNLATTNWHLLTNIVASGSSVSVTDMPPSGDPQRYYRVLAP